MGAAMRWLSLLVLATAALPAFAQTSPSALAPAPTPPVAAGNVRVVLETSEGKIVIDVDPVRAPITAANFLRYVDAGRLDGRIFYRVSRLNERFGIVQFGMRNDQQLSFPPIAHEPTTETGLHHVDGAISMARFDPGTARGEFTLMIGNLTQLDADPAKPGDNVGYAAFGRVVEGMDVVVRILNGEIAPPPEGASRSETPVHPVRILTARRDSAG